MNRSYAAAVIAILVILLLTLLLREGVTSSPVVTGIPEASSSNKLESFTGTASSSNETKAVRNRRTSEQPLYNRPQTDAVTRELINQRWSKARELKDEGNLEGALSELLWLYDEGMVAVTVYSPVRRTALLGEIAALGHTYPPALDALRERIAVAAMRLEERADDEDALRDLVAINRYLGQEHRTVALYDQLAPNDPMRTRVAALIFEPLVRSGRYQDAMTTTTYPRMSAAFDLQAHRGVTRLDSDPERAQQWKDHVAKITVTNIEALAGVGSIEHAAALANKLLLFNDSPETREMLSQAFARAGHPSLMFQSVPPDRP